MFFVRSSMILVSLLGVALPFLNGGCAKGGSDPKSESTSPAVDVRPVVDAPPYMCELVPQAAFPFVSGISVPLQESWGARRKTHSLCALRNGYDRLSVTWQDFDGKNTMRLAHENFDSKRIGSLPPDIGEGLVAHTGEAPRTRPFVSFVWFRCSDKRPWISISLSNVAKGRDPVKDLTALLRIAQQRYGKLHKCTPKP